MFKRGINSCIIFALFEIVNERTDVFQLQLGVNQGGPSSPLLFNFVEYPLMVLMDDLNYSIKFGGMLINSIIYADDTLLVGNNPAEMKKMITALEEFWRANELEINVKKTFLVTTDPTHQNFEIYGNKVECVDQIKYLGSQIQANCSSNVHIEREKH